MRFFKFFSRKNIANENIVKKVCNDYAANNSLFKKYINLPTSYELTATALN